MQWKQVEQNFNFSSMSAVGRRWVASGSPVGRQRVADGSPAGHRHQEVIWKTGLRRKLM